MKEHFYEGQKNDSVESSPTGALRFVENAEGRKILQQEFRLVRKRHTENNTTFFDTITEWVEVPLVSE